MSDVVTPRFWGLSLAALTLGVIGLIIAIGCWIAWAVMVTPGDMPVRYYYSSRSSLLALTIGALWAAMVPVSAVAALYGTISQRRNTASGSGRDNLARAGLVTGLSALLVALAGAATFAWSINQDSGPPPVLPTPAVSPTD